MPLPEGLVMLAFVGRGVVVVVVVGRQRCPPAVC